MSRLRETPLASLRVLGRVRYGGASGQLTVRADSGFYAHALVAVCREMGVCQHKGLRELIEAIEQGRRFPTVGVWPRPPIPPSRVNPTTSGG